MINNKIKWASLCLKNIAKHFFIGMLYLSGTGIAVAIDLESVAHLPLSGDRVELTLHFSEKVPEPNTFSINEPARIVLDFADVTNELNKKTQKIDLGVLKSVSVAEAGGRTRVVINLDEMVFYDVSQENNKIIILIEGSKEPSITLNSLENPGASVSGIDFHRGENGEAQLKIHLSVEGLPVNVYRERDLVVVDLEGVELPEKLQRRLDVIDFGTPVQLIDSVNTSKGTRLTLSSLGKVEHIAYQLNKLLVVEVKSIPEKLTEKERKEEFGYQGEKLSLNFQSIEVRAVLQLLADFTGINLVTSDTVQGHLTLRLKNVPWDQALDIILKTKGLAKRESGNIMLIAPASEIAAREKQELATQKQQIELEMLYSEIIEINFAKASELAALLNRGSNNVEAGAGVTGFLSSVGSVTVDERTNSLLLRDTAEQLVQIRKLVRKLDIPIRQVLIESRIVIANNDFSKELGVRFGVSGQEDRGSDVTNIATSGQLEGTTQLLNGNTLEQSDRLNVNLPVNNPAAASIALALAKLPLGAVLELELSAMQEEGKGEIVSSPRVITSNQKTAVIEQGTEIPYQEASSSGATSVSFKKAVLKLEVTPQITPDNKIVMDLEVTKDEVGEIFLGVPSIDTRKVKTQVLVNNGETIVLGGIYEQRTTETSIRVPFFGDLPGVGRFFRTTKKEDTKRELLIFITPKLVKDSLNSFH